MQSVTLDQVLVDRLLTSKMTRAARAGLSGRTLGEVSVAELLSCAGEWRDKERPGTEAEDPGYAATTAPTPVRPSGYGIQELSTREEDE
jgi:nucleoid-associated protein YgaU